MAARTQSSAGALNSLALLFIQSPKPLCTIGFVLLWVRYGVSGLVMGHLRYGSIGRSPPLDCIGDHSPRFFATYSGSSQGFPSLRQSADEVLGCVDWHLCTDDFEVQSVCGSFGGEPGSRHRALRRSQGGDRGSGPGQEDLARRLIEREHQVHVAAHNSLSARMIRPGVCPDLGYWYPRQGSALSNLVRTSSLAPISSALPGDPMHQGDRPRGCGCKLRGAFA